MTTPSFPQQENERFACYDALVATLEKLYISIAVFDLATGRAMVLKSALDPEIVGMQCDWDVLIARYAARRACEVDRAAIFKRFSRENLEAFAVSDKQEMCMEVRCLNASGSFEWVEISLCTMDAANRQLLITTRSIDQQKFLQSIVARFIYRNCDYFMLIDTRRDSYKVFSATEDRPVPSASGKSYTDEMLRFNKQFVVPEDMERVTANMQIPHLLKQLESGEEYTFTCGGLTKGDAYRRSRVQFVYYDKPAGLILLMRTDITLLYLEEKSRNEQLLATMCQAQTDALTGLYNQKTCTDLIARSLSRQDYRTAALLFVDVDNFKQVNDTLGHLKGDELLQFLAAAFQKIAGPRDLIGRVGGDEFLLYLPDADSHESVAQFAERICGIFDEITPDICACPNISCSVGVAVYPQDGTDYKMLVRKADQALYNAKRYGKNTYYFFSESLGGKAFPSMFSAIDKNDGLRQ